MNVYCALKQGEPGMGEKGERGMDGLPGLKVEKKHLKRHLNNKINTNNYYFTH